MTLHRRQGNHSKGLNFLQCYVVLTYFVSFNTEWRWYSPGLRRHYHNDHHHQHQFILWLTEPVRLETLYNDMGYINFINWMLLHFYNVHTLIGPSPTLRRKKTFLAWKREICEMKTRQKIPWMTVRIFPWEAFSRYCPLSRSSTFKACPSCKLLRDQNFFPLLYTYKMWSGVAHTCLLTTVKKWTIWLPWALMRTAQEVNEV